MKRTNISVMISFIAALGGCGGPASTPATSEHNRLSVSALPIIQEAVFELTPLFDGQRNLPLMEQMCALARGQLTQTQIDAFLKQLGIEAGKIPREGNPLSLMVNGDQSGQLTACAAFLATSVISTVDVTEFSHRSTETANGTKPADASLQIDPALMKQVLPVKLAEARTNAEVFALIATELQRRPGLTIAEYRALAGRLFQALAPTYLQRVKEQFPSADTQYSLIRLDVEMFSFASSGGDLFEFSAYNGLTLRKKGIVEYGEGKLLGQAYPLQAKIFPESVGKLLELQLK